MSPEWFFTSPVLEDYMKVAVHKIWDTLEVGTKLEAFVITGCDTVSEYIIILIMLTWISHNSTNC